MAVIAEGKFLGYSVEPYTTKDGKAAEQHTVRLLDQWGFVENVRIPTYLVPEAAQLRNVEFGEIVSFVCKHKDGFENYQRTSVLEMMQQTFAELHGDRVG